MGDAMAFAVVAQRFCIAVVILAGVAVTTPPDPTDDPVKVIPGLHEVKGSAHEHAEQHLVKNKESQKKDVSEDKTQKIQESAHEHAEQHLVKHKESQKKEVSEDKTQKIQESAHDDAAGSLVTHKTQEKLANEIQKKAEDVVIQKNAGDDLVIQKKADPKDIKKELRITPTKLMAILFFMLWMSFFLTGFCCLFHVQTPQTYEEKCLVLNKQY